MRNLKKYSLGMFCALMFVASNIYSQDNGLVRYDAITGNTDFISTVSIDSTKVYNLTNFSTGELDKISDLALNKSLSHIPGSGFTDIYNASSWFQPTSYPARTVVKLFYYRNGTLHELCSGTLISDNIVTTSAHCIYYYFDENDIERAWLDSILVIPSYDNSIINPDIGRTVSTKFYVFENWYNEIDLDYDMAFIELEEPIGSKSGWVGIGYNLETDFYTTSIFHNFSYPSAVHPFDSSRVYDGNLLFYSYGHMDTVANYEIGHKVNAIPGQSGSSLIHSDNKNYQLHGVLSNHLYGYGTLFNRITPNKFYAIKNLLENETALVDKESKILKTESNTIEKLPISTSYNLVKPTISSKNINQNIIYPLKKSKKENTR